MSARGGLGRGLAALLPGGGGTVEQVDIDLIAPNPDQPRQVMEREGLEELASSVSRYGILQPLIATRNTTETGAVTFTLIAGERRLRAARLAGIPRVPVIVRETQETERLELALVENLQRAELGPLEEAEAYERLVEEFGLTQEEVARRVGRGRVAVANSIRLLGLSGAIKARLARGDISAGHARALLGAADEAERSRILELVLSRGLNVRQTEELVRGAKPDAKQSPAQRVNRGADAEVNAMEERLRAALATDVEVQPGRRGGKIVIQYYDDDDLQEILAVLLKGRGAIDRVQT
jgi:ParB family chromosome partitioning protein